MGLNPGTVYWMVVSDASLLQLNSKIKIKVVKWGKPEKMFNENEKKKTSGT